MDSAAEITRISDERMRDLASQQGNVVYEYQYDTPQKPADVSQTLKFAKLIIQERAKVQDVQDEEARRLILEREPVLKPFVVDHPKIFEMMTDKIRCGENFNMLCRLATFKRTSDHQGLSLPQATASVSQFLMSECQRPASGEQA
jgi:hypothetical protein